MGRLKMLIKLYYDDEYVKGKSDYSYFVVNVDSWENFWNIWNNSSDFFRCDDTSQGKRVYIKKDRVIGIMED